jgi:hypothetical protein
MPVETTKTTLRGVSWPDSVEGEPVRAKLALLVAAAVVFAPGWPPSDGSSVHPAGDSLAGRILAPTVDEANVASDAAAVKAKRLERVKPRAGSWKTVAGRSASSSLPPPASLWWPLLAVAVAGAIALAPSPRSPRAPPQVLTV